MSGEDKKTPYQTNDGWVKIDESTNFNHQISDNNRIIRSASTQTVEDALSTLTPPQNPTSLEKKST